MRNAECVMLKAVSGLNDSGAAFVFLSYSNFAFSKVSIGMNCGLVFEFLDTLLKICLVG